MAVPIKRTKLYRATVKHVGIDKRKYAKELSKARACLLRKKEVFGWYCTSLMSAFVWHATPQGGTYWAELYSRRGVL